MLRSPLRPDPRILLALLVALPLAGCVRRTLTITSEPPGALTYVNDREIGRTPATVDFLYYGEYDVRLVLEGYETLSTSGQAKAPWWDTIGVDLIAEMVPGEQHSQVHWHYELSPVDNDSNALRARASELRERVAEEAPPPPERASPGEEPDEQG
jgi:hypothetical protein